jgi:hypothetical protein
VKKRYFKRKPKLPKGYDSHLEVDLHEGPLKGYEHHPAKLSYKIEHLYQADFVDPDEPNILIECKGRARDRAELMKYVHIQNCNPDYEIVFILEKPNVPMPFAKKRKDGSKQTHEDFLEKHGFRYFYKDTIPDSWRKS